MAQLANLDRSTGNIFHIFSIPVNTDGSFFFPFLKAGDSYLLRATRGDLATDKFFNLPLVGTATKDLGNLFINATDFITWTGKIYSKEDVNKTTPLDKLRVYLNYVNDPLKKFVPAPFPSQTVVTDPPSMNFSFRLQKGQAYRAFIIDPSGPQFAEAPDSYLNNPALRGQYMNYENIFVASDANFTQDILLSPGGILEGNIYVNGTLAASKSISLSLMPSGFVGDMGMMQGLFKELTVTNGHYRFQGLKPREYALKINYDPQNTAGQSEPNLTQKVFIEREGGKVVKDIFIDFSKFGYVEGKVIDNAGNPIASANVTLEIGSRFKPMGETTTGEKPPDEFGIERRGTPVFQCMTDSEGRYSFKTSTGKISTLIPAEANPPELAYKIRAMRFDAIGNIQESVSPEFDILPGLITNQNTLMVRKFKIYGKITLDGVINTFSKFDVRFISDLEKLENWGQTAQTDGLGQYAFPLTPGSYTMVIQAGGNGSKIVFLTPISMGDADLNKDINIEKAKLATLKGVTKLQGDNLPLPNTFVFVRRIKNIGTFQAFVDLTQMVTNELGQFEFNISPGTYHFGGGQWNTWDPDPTKPPQVFFSPIPSQVTLTGGTTTVKDLVYSKGNNLTVDVSATDFVVGSDSAVLLQPQAFKMDEANFNPANGIQGGFYPPFIEAGYLKFPGLAAGEYLLRLTSNSKNWSILKKVVISGSTTIKPERSDGTFTLNLKSRLDGSLLDADVEVFFAYNDKTLAGFPRPMHLLRTSFIGGVAKLTLPINWAFRVVILPRDPMFMPQVFEDVVLTAEGLTKDVSFGSNASLEGRILYNGNGIAGNGVVGLMPAFQGDVEGKVVFGFAEKGNNGLYKIQNINPGKYYGYALSDDVGAAAKFIPPMEVAPGNRKVADFPVVSVPRKISGTLKGPGGLVGLPGVTIRAFRKVHPKAPLMSPDPFFPYVLDLAGKNFVVTDKDGKFSMNVEPNVNYFLIADTPRQYAPPKPRFCEVLDADFDASNALGLETFGVIRGKLINKAGVEIPGWVQVESLFRNEGVEEELFIRQPASGTFEVKGLAVGQSYRLFMEPTDTTLQKLMVIVPAVAPATVGTPTYIFDQGYKISGFIQDGKGNNLPLAGIRVNLVLPFPGQQPIIVPTTSLDDGSFEFTGIPAIPEKAIISTVVGGEVDEGLSSGTVDFAVNKTTPFLVSSSTPVQILNLVEGGGVSGKVFREDGSPLGRFWVEISTPQGFVWTEGKVGSFTMTHLPAGVFNIFIHSPEYPPYTVPRVSIEPGKINNLGQVVIPGGTFVLGVLEKLQDLAKRFDPFRGDENVTLGIMAFPSDKELRGDDLFAGNILSHISGTTGVKVDPASIPLEIPFRLFVRYGIHDVGVFFYRMLPDGREYATLFGWLPRVELPKHMKERERQLLKKLSPPLVPWVKVSGIATALGNKLGKKNSAVVFFPALGTQSTDLPPVRFPVAWAAPMSGEFVVEHIPAGIYDVKLIARSFPDLVIRNVNLLADKNDLSLAITDAGSYLNGLVSDASGGAMLEGVKVVLNEHQTTFTDASGFYEFKGLPKKFFGLLQFHKPLYAPQRKKIEGTLLPASFSVSLDSNIGVIFGKIVNQEGKEIPGVRIGVMNFKADKSVGFGGEFQSGDDGTFELSLPSLATYVVALAKEGHDNKKNQFYLPTQSRVEWKENASGTILLQFRRPSVTCRMKMVEAAGKKVATVFIRFEERPVTPQTIVIKRGANTIGTVADGKLIDDDAEIGSGTTQKVRFNLDFVGTETIELDVTAKDDLSKDVAGKIKIFGVSEKQNTSVLNPEFGGKVGLDENFGTETNKEKDESGIEVPANALKELVDKWLVGTETTCVVKKDSKNATASEAIEEKSSTGKDQVSRRSLMSGGLIVSKIAGARLVSLKDRCKLTFQNLDMLPFELLTLPIIARSLETLPQGAIPALGLGLELALGLEQALEPAPALEPALEPEVAAVAAVEAAVEKLAL
ncbi:carboxypeptidase regulatory-like domain-containing protein [bacterium]|nr:carboxypeptidase regulatory-like domain-containing protein [bacterium]